jgi:membrane-bound lytic murein transglycosylase F
MLGLPSLFMAGRVTRGAALASAFLVGSGALSLTACTENKLQAVKSAGELVVLTDVSPTTYYATPEGPAGFEYDLAKAFADSLGVKLRIVAAERFSDVLPRLLNGEADFAAAGITITDSRRRAFRFTPPYQEVRQQVIYRQGSPRPGNASDLVGREIEVQAGTSYVERLRELKGSDPDLHWTEVDDKQTDELLELVWEGLLDVTIADSNIVAVNRQYFPELQVAFDLEHPQGIAWAFRREDDDSLCQEAARFLAAQRASGDLASLIDRYYGPASRSNFINMTIYQLRVRNRLPLYQSLFERAGAKYDIDWRVLAAMGYQESYWDPKAVSPTGVRGLMMLTEDTARHMGVRDRMDPAASIDGGARYISRMIERMPKTVVDPDRLWLALAAYNIGINHLEDARQLTQKQHGDPNKWNDVKDRLPLLEIPKWAAQTRFGLARGREAVIFVNRIRAYQDVLVRLDEEQRARSRSSALGMKAPAL